MKIEPIIKTDLTDTSSNDESFNQQGTTVHIGNGATYNQNCGIKKEFPRLFFPLLLIVSLFFGLGWFMDVRIRENETAEKLDIQEITHTLNLMSTDSKHIHESLIKSIEQTKSEIEVAKSQAKEGSIWLLRHDILKMIDFYSQTKIITQKQFSCLKDEFDYYKSIGGNHDVETRYTDFVVKIFGTGEIKMVNCTTPLKD